jgi:DNA-binding NtrC family response regulator
MARIALAPPAAISPQAPRSMLPLLSGDGEVRRLDDVEADMIRFAVTHYRGQISEVARRLGIGRSTLYRKMQALGMAPALNGDAPNVAIR